MSEFEEPRHELAQELQRRNHLFHRLQITVITLIIDYFFLPYDVQA